MSRRPQAPRDPFPLRDDSRDARLAPSGRARSARASSSAAWSTLNGRTALSISRARSGGATAYPIRKPAAA